MTSKTWFFFIVWILHFLIGLVGIGVWMLFAAVDYPIGYTPNRSEAEQALIYVLSYALPIFGFPLFPYLVSGNYFFDWFALMLLANSCLIASCATLVLCGLGRHKNEAKRLST
jgi:hypothetical protein